MGHSEWKKVRTYQHPALPDMATLEIHQNTLEFRIQVQGKTFTGKDGEEVLKRAREYLQSLPVPGNWQPLIELARYCGHMETNRRFVQCEQSGAILQHPWVQAPGEIALVHITEMRFHRSEYDRSLQKFPPCTHHDGLSTYVHLPYTPQVWERVQVMARAFNGFFATCDDFLKAVGVTRPQEKWEAHFLELWQRLSFFEEDPHKRENLPCA